MATKKKVTRYVYIGPKLSKHGLWPFAVFLNGLPAQAQELIEKNAWFAKLFVSLDALATAKAELQKTGSPLNIYYNRAKEV